MVQVDPFRGHIGRRLAGRVELVRHLVHRGPARHPDPLVVRNGPPQQALRVEQAAGEAWRPVRHEGGRGRIEHLDAVLQPGQEDRLPLADQLRHARAGELRPAIGERIDATHHPLGVANHDAGAGRWGGGGHGADGVPGCRRSIVALWAMWDGFGRRPGGGRDNSPFPPKYSVIFRFRNRTNNRKEPGPRKTPRPTEIPRIGAKKSCCSIGVTMTEYTSERARRPGRPPRREVYSRLRADVAELWERLGACRVRRRPPGSGAESGMRRPIIPRRSRAILSS